MSEMLARDAYLFIRDLVAEHVKLEGSPEVTKALNTIHLAINENDNLHTDLDEAQRQIRDIYKQLDELRQVVFA
jgi:hypothetical protein